MSECSTSYDVASEPANANSIFTCRQLIRGYSDKAKTDVRRLKSRSATVRRSFTASVAPPKTRTSSLKVALSKVCGSHTKALLDSRAVPKLISEDLCNTLDLAADRNPTGLTVVDGQQARSAGSVSKVANFFDHLHTYMDFHDLKNALFDVTTGVPALEELRGCMYFGLKQVILLADDEKALFLFK